jgi:ParB family chromosome partitioning protein
MARKFDLAKAWSGESLVFNSDTEEIQLIHSDQITGNPENFYRIGDLEELAQDIEVHGILQPLLVTEDEPNHYRLIAGHRRLKAFSQNNPDGGKVPCIVLSPKSAMEEELMLITTNSTARQLSDWEIMEQAKRLNNLIQRMREGGAELPKGVKTRTLVADQLGVSESKVARLSAIQKNLHPEELVERFQAGELPEDVAYKISQLPQESQAELEQEVGQTESITRATVEEFKKSRAGESVPKPRAKKKPAASPTGGYWNYRHDNLAAGNFVFAYKITTSEVSYRFFDGKMFLKYGNEDSDSLPIGSVWWYLAPIPPTMSAEELEEYRKKYLNKP